MSPEEAQEIAREVLNGTTRSYVDAARVLAEVVLTMVHVVAERDALRAANAMLHDALVAEKAKAVAALQPGEDKP